MQNRTVTLSKGIEEYFRSDRMRTSARGTRDQHRRTLAALVRVCGRDRMLTQLTAADFAGTIELLSRPADEIELAATELNRGARGVRRGRNEYTLNMDRSVLRTFIRFLHDADLLTRAHDPSAALRSVPKRRSLSHKRQPMSRDTVVELLELAGQHHPRERMTMAFAVLAGLRESEIRRLQWRDVLWHAPDGPILDFYRDKGRDAHRVAINATLEQELRTWHAFYAERHPEMRPSWYVVPARQRGFTPGGKMGLGMCNEWPLLPDRRQGRQSKPIIKDLMAQLGVTDLYGKGMHTLRRTFANVLLEDTKDIRVVQNALGHASQLTTEVYLDLDRDFTAAAKVMRTWDPFSKIPRSDGNVIPIRRRRDVS